jgi:hypothetical protein
VRQGCGGPRLALPSHPGGKGGEQAQRRAQAQGDGNSNKKKAGGTQPLAGAHNAATAAAGGGMAGREATNALVSRPIVTTAARSARCTTPHAIPRQCWKIKKVAEQFREKMQQQRQDGAPSHQREGKQKVDPQEEKDAEMEFQDAKRALKAVYGHSDSESSDNEHCKALHIKFGGS